jgi:hypothetical protein
MFVFLDLSKIEPPVTLWVSIFMRTVSEAVHFVFVLCRPGYIYLFCIPSIYQNHGTFSLTPHVSDLFVLPCTKLLICILFP